MSPEEYTRITGHRLRVNPKFASTYVLQIPKRPIRANRGILWFGLLCGILLLMVSIWQAGDPIPPRDAHRVMVASPEVPQ